MLIAMAVYDTDENNRSWMTNVTLMSLAMTVDTTKHRVFVVDNASCDKTKEILAARAGFATVITNETNLGTAKAINQAWRHREPGEHCVKMDNDVVIRQPSWADWMEDVFYRDPRVGICGLKRKDLAEAPWSMGDMRSVVRMLPHEAGQRWLVVEDVKHVIGTCQGYNSALLDEIGYLTQPGVYGFDDAIASVRCRLAGFDSVFLHGFEIEHIDPGGDEYCAWKVQEASRRFPEYNSIVMLLESGAMPLHYDGGFGDE
jgi:GT2 family glycosyltransferase